MKPRILLSIICLFTFSIVMGQKGYKHVYKFQLDKPKDMSSIIIDTLYYQGITKKINGKVTNNNLEPLSFLTVIFKSKDTTIYNITNAKGLFEINVKPAIYEMTISGVNYVSISKTLLINDKMIYDLNIKLAKQASLEYYNINSKIKLTKDDIENIIKCVEANPGNPIKCGRKNAYYITIEI